MVVMAVDHSHDVNALKRLVDGSWQLWCRCGTICTERTVAKVTVAHAEHIMGEHIKDIYGEDAPPRQVDLT